MPIPNLTAADVVRLIPEATNLTVLDRGGQKIVFTGSIQGQVYALKFMSPNPSNPADKSALDDVTARVQREVETMQQCATPHLVRMGRLANH